MNNVLMQPPSSAETLRLYAEEAIDVEASQSAPEVLTRASEKAGILGKLVLASFELQTADDLEMLPEVRAGMIEGWHDDVENIAESPEKTNQYVSANIELLDKLNE